jgi:hypothetical protein
MEELDQPYASSRSLVKGVTSKTSSRGGRTSPNVRANEVTSKESPLKEVVAAIKRLGGGKQGGAETRPIISEGERDARRGGV